MDSNNSGKRLAKNTVMMYIRMGVTMIVALITTRVVLQVLGVDNYGLYDVVSGIIVLFSFLNSALTAATQRYFSYELGKGNNERLKDIYSTSLKIYGVVVLAILFLGETIGLWYLNNVMKFAPGQIESANFVYQVSLIIASINIFRAPYNALIVANEKFSFYAYTSIVEAVLNLGIVFLLSFRWVSPVYFYIVLQLAVVCILFTWYFVYIKRHFKYVYFCKVRDKGLYKEILSFSGWGIFGALANVGFRQGISLVINYFFGVSMNAPFGLANRVSGVVNQFVSGFQVAFNPQLVKSHAAGDIEKQSKLVFQTSLISFYLLLLVGVPVLFNLDYLLSIWLVSVPAHAASLCSLMIIAETVDAITAPLWVTIFATGNIKYYQISIITIILLNVISSFVVLYFGAPVESTMVIRVIMYVVIIVDRLYFMKRLTKISVREYVKRVLSKASIIIIITIFLFVLLNPISQGANRLFVITPLFIVALLFSVYYIGLSVQERAYVYNVFKQKINRNRDV